MTTDNGVRPSMDGCAVGNSRLSTMDRFADLLAEGLTVAAAAKRVGVDAAYGNAMLQRMRKRLGLQAV